MTQGLLGDVLAFIDRNKNTLKKRGPQGLLSDATQALNDFGAQDRMRRPGLLGSNSVMPGVRDAAITEAMEHPATKALMNFAPLGMIAYHGSPHLFDKFDPAKAGKHGGTSFGLGHNFSVDPKHAKAYGDNLYKVDIADEAIDKFLRWEDKAPPSLLERVPKVAEDAPFPFGGGATVENVGGQWTLKAGDSAFKLSEREVKRMFGSEGTGEQVYRRLVASLGGDEAAASEWLRKAGIPGIKNTTERGAENYTVFPGMESLVKILERM
jgi:hypothetical protein